MNPLKVELPSNLNDFPISIFRYSSYVSVVLAPHRRKRNLIFWFLVLRRWLGKFKSSDRVYKGFDKKYLYDHGTYDIGTLKYDGLYHESLSDASLIGI